MDNSASSSETTPSKPGVYVLLGILVGCLVAYIGVAFANDTFGQDRPAIGVGFIAFCAGVAFEWRRIGSIRLTSLAAGYLCALGIVLGIKLKAPAFWFPLIVGLALFALGILIRQFVTTKPTSPQT